MKKFWKIIGVLIIVVFILVVVALVGGFIFLKNFDIAKYKPQIIQMTSQALGRPVDFKNIDLKVSLDEGIKFRLSDFSIAENSDFGTEAFFAAGEIDADLDILSLLTARQISVSNILIHSPRINVVRNEKGILNAQTFGQPAPGEAAKKPEALMPAVALPAIFINSFKIENAELHFIDQSVQPEQKIAITQLNIGVRNFSLINPFDFSIDGAVLSAQTDLRINGKVQLKLAASQAKFTDIEVATDLNQLALDDLRAIPILKGVPLPKILKGQLKTKLKEAVVSDKGLGALLMDISLVGGQIIAPNIVPGISLEANHLDFSLNNFSLDGAAPSQVNLTAALYQEQTNIDFIGAVSWDPKTMGVRVRSGQFSTDLTLWPLEKIKLAIVQLKDTPLPEHLAGKFQTTIKDLQISTAGLQTVLLDAQLSGGEIVLKNVLPQTAVELNKVDLIVKDLSLDKPFFISLQTAYLSDDPDFSFEGNVGLDLKTQAATMKDVAVALDFDKLSLERLKSSGLVPAGTPFPHILGGKLKTRVNNLAASAKGITQMNVDLEWQKGKIAIAEVAPGISVTANSIDLNAKNISFKDPFTVAASLGYESDVPNISFDGQVAFDPATQNVRLSQATFKTDLSKIPFAHLKETLAPLKTMPVPEILEGQLDVMIKELSAGPKGLTSVMTDAALKDGKVSMKEVAPGISFAASQINVAVKDFGFGTSFGFNIGLAYLHDTSNIQVKGLATVRREEQSIAFKDVAVETDLSTFAMAELKSSVVALKNASLPEKLQGMFKMTITDAVAGSKGLVSLTSQGSLSGGAAKLKELSVPIQGLDTTFRLTQKDFTMDTIKASLGKGQIVAQVGLSDYLTSQNFTLSAEIKEIDFSEILNQAQAPVKVEGLVFGKLNAQGQGADTNSITGEGNFEVKQAKLKDLNVLKTVLDKISFLPNASSRIEASLPEKYKDKLNNKDTEINTITAPCKISNGVIVLDPISVEADEFVLSGKSQAGFDGKYALDGAFKIPAELSTAMVAGVPEMQYLFDEDKNISLPVHVSGQGGQVPAISVTQTAIDMGKNAIRNEGKKQLEKILNKALGTGEQPTSSDSQTQQPAGTSQDQTSPAGEIIDNLFKKILK